MTGLVPNQPGSSQYVRQDGAANTIRPRQERLTVSGNGSSQPEKPFRPYVYGASRRHVVTRHLEYGI